MVNVTEVAATTEEEPASSRELNLFVRVANNLAGENEALCNEVKVNEAVIEKLFTIAYKQAKRHQRNVPAFWKFKEDLYNEIRQDINQQQ